MYERMNGIKISEYPGEYNSWNHMRRRCYDKNHHKYKDYGGRGISVCDRWRTSFKNFILDIGKKPSQEYSIDRIDNNGNYCQKNCKWSNPKEQSAPKRRRARRAKRYYFNKRDKVWIVRFSINGKRKDLQRFKNEKDAHYFVISNFAGQQSVC